jgi:hypothetical protein
VTRFPSGGAVSLLLCVVGVGFQQRIFCLKLHTILLVNDASVKTGGYKPSKGPSAVLNPMLFTAQFEFNETRRWKRGASRVSGLRDCGWLAGLVSGSNSRSCARIALEATND